jgi:hypothetical protein
MDEHRLRHMAVWNEKSVSPFMAQSVLIRIAIWRNLRFLAMNPYLSMEPLVPIVVIKSALP